MDYRPNLSDIEEYYQDMEYGLEEAITYLRLAIAEVNQFKEFKYLTHDIECVLESAKDELRGLTNGK